MLRRVIGTSLIAASVCGVLAGATVVADSLWANVSIEETLRPDFLFVDAPTVEFGQLDGLEERVTLEEELVKDWVETRARPSRCF